MSFLPSGISSGEVEALMNRVLCAAMRPSRPGGTWTTERHTDRGCPAGQRERYTRDDAGGGRRMTALPAPGALSG